MILYLLKNTFYLTMDTAQPIIKAMNNDFGFGSSKPKCAFLFILVKVILLDIFLLVQKK